MQSDEALSEMGSESLRQTRRCTARNLLLWSSKTSMTRCTDSPPDGEMVSGRTGGKGTGSPESWRIDLGCGHSLFSLSSVTTGGSGLSREEETVEW